MVLERRQSYPLSFAGAGQDSRKDTFLEQEGTQVTLARSRQAFAQDPTITQGVHATKAEG